MTDSVECLRCHVPMETGFIADRTYGKWVEEKWSPGEPQLHWWGLEKSEGAMPVITLRCPRCGVLESYARPA
jgi:hypothetical protein